MTPPITDPGEFLEELGRYIAKGVYPYITTDDFVAIDPGTADESLLDTDLFFHVALYEQLPPVGQRGKAADPAWLPCLVADIDLDGKQRKDGLLSYPSRSQANAILSDFPVPPTYVIESSDNGLYGLWQVTKPQSTLAPETDDALRIWRDALVQIWSGGHGVGIDRNVLTDKARVLRLPGSLNHKYEAPVRVRIVEHNKPFNGDLLELARYVHLYAQRFDPAPASETGADMPSTGAQSEHVELSLNYFLAQEVDYRSLFAGTGMTFLDGSWTVGPEDKEIYYEGSSSVSRSALLSPNGVLVIFSNALASHLQERGFVIKRRDLSGTPRITVGEMVEQTTPTNETMLWTRKARKAWDEAHQDYNYRKTLMVESGEVPDDGYPFKAKLVAEAMAELGREPVAPLQTPDEPSPFPAEAFPIECQLVADAIFETRQTDRAMILASMLPILGAACSGRFVIEDHPDHENPNMMVLVGAASGLGKSKVAKVLLAPMRRWSNELNHRYRRRHDELLTKLERLQSSEDTLPEETAPIIQLLERKQPIPYLNGGSAENVRELATTEHGLLYATADALTSNLFQDSNDGALSVFLEGHSGDDVLKALKGSNQHKGKYDRSSEITAGVGNCNALIMTQTEHAREFFFDAKNFITGMSARFLYIQVERTFKVDYTRKSEFSSEQIADMDRWSGIVYRICEKYRPLDETYVPQLVPFSTTAKQILTQWQQTHCKPIIDDGDEKLHATVNKYDHMPRRIALAFAVFEATAVGSLAEIQVTSDHMQRACAIMSWFLDTTVNRVQSSDDSLDQLAFLATFDKFTKTDLREYPQEGFVGKNQTAYGEANQKIIDRWVDKGFVEPHPEHRANYRVSHEGHQKLRGELDN